jgi:hypothetical protein
VFSEREYKQTIKCSQNAIWFIQEAHVFGVIDLGSQGQKAKLWTAYDERRRPQ